MRCTMGMSKCSHVSRDDSNPAMESMLIPKLLSRFYVVPFLANVSRRLAGLHTSNSVRSLPDMGHLKEACCERDVVNGTSMIFTPICVKWSIA